MPNTNDDISRLPQVNVVTMSRVSEPHRILAQLSEVQQKTSLVIAFCCDARLATRLYREASKLNMLNGDWVWLALEQATGRWSRVEAGPHHAERSANGSAPGSSDLPLGLLGLVSQQPLRLSKHTMKGALAIVHSALRASLGARDARQAWSASWADPAAPLGPIRLEMARKLHRYPATVLLSFCSRRIVSNALCASYLTYGSEAKRMLNFIDFMKILHSQKLMFQLNGEIHENPESDLFLLEARFLRAVVCSSEAKRMLKFHRDVMKFLHSLKLVFHLNDEIHL